MTRYKRTTLAEIGDVTPEDYGGGALMRVGPYLTLEYTYGAECDLAHLGLESGSREERLACLEVFRVDIPTIGRGLCDIDGIRSNLDWIDWPKVARSADLDAWEILEIALDPERAWVLYEIAAGYYGWRELDPEPLQVPYWRVARRWTAPRRAHRAA